MREVFQKYLYPLWPIFTFVIVVPGLFCSLTYNVPNEITSVTFKYLGLPLFVGFMYFGYKFLWDDTCNHLIAILTGVLATFFLLMIFSGHVLWVNHLIGTQQIITLEGKIIDLDSGTRGRGGKPHIFIESQEARIKMKIAVSYSDFPNYQIGQMYSQKWTKGSLGIIYRI